MKTQTYLLVSAFAISAAACGDGNTAASDAGALDATDAAPPPVPLPDLRFKLVGAFPAYSSTEFTGGGGGEASTAAIFSPIAATGGTFSVAAAYAFAPARTLTPFQSIDDDEPTSAVTLFPGGIETTYVLYSLAYDSGDVLYTGIAPPGDLVASFNVESAQPTVGELSAYVADAATRGYVITAIAYDGTQLQAAAYALPHDTQTYTATVMTGAPATLAAAAPSLVASGAVITAFGPIDATNYAIIATTVSGMTTARTVKVAPDEAGGGTGTTAGSLLAQGYAIVGGYYDSTSTPQFILEK